MADDMVFHAVFIPKASKEPCTLCDAACLRRALGSSSKVKMIGHELHVTVATNCKNRDILMQGMRSKMDETNLSQNWEPAEGWSLKSAKRKSHCRVMYHAITMYCNWVAQGALPYPCSAGRFWDI